jgi:hypothetical protein
VVAGLASANAAVVLGASLLRGVVAVLVVAGDSEIGVAAGVVAGVAVADEAAVADLPSPFSSLAAVASSTLRGESGDGAIWCSPRLALNAGELGAEVFFSISLEKLTMSCLLGTAGDAFDSERFLSLYCLNSLSTDSVQPTTHVSLQFCSQRGGMHVPQERAST